MNERFLDVATVVSLIFTTYALYIALENLEENREQNIELKSILRYLETHLKNQDKVLENIIR